MGFRGRLCLLAVLALGIAVPAAQAAEPVFEKYKVPTVGGAEINVEVMRPEGDAQAPVILTYSPYNTLVRVDHAEPRERRPRPDLRAARLRPGRGRRPRHAQLVGLLGLRRSRRAAVGRRPRQLPREPAVVERQGRDDRRLLRRHDRQHGRRAWRRRARAGRDRARGRHLALVRLRVRRRRALLPELGGRDRRGLRHAARLRLRARPHAADGPERPAVRATSSRAEPTPASPSSTRWRATAARPTTTTSGSSATT